MPKVLILDIETSPNLATVWGLWNQNVALNQLLQVGQVISFAAKWRGDKKVEFFSDFHDGHEVMTEKAHALLDEADVLVHYHGDRFDLPHLRREFLLAGMAPPSPAASVDLKAVVAKRFRFPSNKLAHVTAELGLSGKLSHTGHQLWLDCMNNDPKAWALMKKYNVQDVRATEELYERLLPWIKHPNVNLIDGQTDSPACPNCGSSHLQRRGWSHTLSGSYPRLHCQACGAWSRSTARERHVSTVGVVA